MSAKNKAEIIECCKQLKLQAIAESYEAMMTESSDYEDFLLKILRLQVEDMEKKAIQRRIKAAKFPVKKYLEDLEIDCLPPAMSHRLPELESLKFIENGQNIILTGNPGTGKTHTAIGLGLKACEAGYKVLFTTVPLLITELKECNSAKKLSSYQKKFEKYDLVILDELGYISFDRVGADLLFSNLSLRALNKATIITSNLTFNRWDEIFGDPAITSAMVDRLTFRALLIDMEGDSYRLRETLRLNGTDYEYIREVQNNAV